MRVARTLRHSNFSHRIFDSNHSISRVLLFVLLSIGLLVGISTDALAQNDQCSLVKGATKDASDIRGLKIRKKVPCKIQNKKEVEQYLLTALKEKVPATRLKNEGQLYKMLGIIPKDFQYLEGIVALYTSQLGGYYDPEKDYYAMEAWMPAALQYPIAVHEMVHALQDQYYDLDKLMDHFTHDSDLLAARSALAEGDATAVMMDYSRRGAGQGPIAEEKNVAGIMMQNIAGAMLSSSMQETPSTLQAMLIFPYVSGLRFAHALLQEGGYERIDQAFAVLPESTEHILHPEIFLRGERSFIDVPTPGVPESIKVESTKPVYDDRMGEFFIATVLGSQIPARAASRAASGWGGDRVALYQLEGSSRYLLVWAQHWDTEKDADEFFEALTKYFAKRLSVEQEGTGVVQKFLDPNFGPIEIKKSAKNTRLTIGR